MGILLEVRTYCSLVLRIGWLALSEVSIPRTCGWSHIFEYLCCQRWKFFIRSHGTIYGSHTDEKTRLHHGWDEGIFPRCRPCRGSIFRRNSRMNSCNWNFRCRGYPLGRTADWGLASDSWESEKTCGKPLKRSLIFCDRYMGFISGIKKVYCIVPILLSFHLMNWFHANIESLTLDNQAFRKVLYTAKHTQLVLMTLQPGEDIWEEVHPGINQFFRFESGVGKCIIDWHEYPLTPRSAIIVPSGTKHNIINTSTTEVLQMYTLYSPPHHQDGIVRMTKLEAEADAPEFDGITTE